MVVDFHLRHLVRRIIASSFCRMLGWLNMRKTLINFILAKATIDK